TIVRDCVDSSDTATFAAMVRIIVRDGGSFVCEPDISLSNIDFPYLTIGKAEFSTLGASFAPSNVFQLPTSGALDGTYGIQRTANSDSMLTLDPSATFNRNPIYLGKEFSIISTNARKHQVTLAGGAKFVGRDSGKVFLSQPGSIITFRVLSPTEVLIVDVRTPRVTGNAVSEDGG